MRVLVLMAFLVASPIAVSAATPEEKIKAAVNGHQFNHRIDDTRTAWAKVGPVKTKVGTAGVEYLLDDTKIEVVKVTIAEIGSGLLTKDFNITVRAKCSGGKYKEKHFRGVGSEYHTKSEQSPSAEIDFIYIVDSKGLRIREAKKITHSGSGRSYEQLEQGGVAKILERLKTVL